MQTNADKRKANCVQCVGGRNLKTSPGVGRLFKDFRDALYSQDTHNRSNTCLWLCKWYSNVSPMTRMSSMSTMQLVLVSPASTVHKPNGMTELIESRMQYMKAIFSWDSGAMLNWQWPAVRSSVMKYLERDSKSNWSSTLSRGYTLRQGST